MMPATPASVEAASFSARARWGWLVVPLGVVALLFEPLFLDRSLLSFDNRIYAPFCANAPAGGLSRPMNLVTSDINGWILPETMVQLERLRRGEVPLWNPFMNLGQPLLANLGFPPFYPAVVLYLVLDPLRAYAVSMAIHLVLLGWSMQLFLRRRGLAAGPAWLGAVVAAFSGFALVHLHLPHFVRTIAWFPLLLLVGERFVAQPGPRSTGCLALVSGLSLLAGFPQLALINLYAAAAYLLVMLVLEHRSAWRRVLAFAVPCAVLTGLVAAIQMLPALELLRHSWRSGGLGLEQARRKALEPELTAGYVLPHLFGSPVQIVEVPPVRLRPLQDFLTYREWLDEDVQNNFIENTLYIGLLPLALAVVALLGVRGWRELFFALLALSSLALALGAPGFLEAARALPGLLAGSPKRVLFLPAFAGAFLASSGLGKLLAGPRRLEIGVLVVAGSAGVLLAMAAILPYDVWLFPDAPEADRALLRATLLPDLAKVGGAGGALLLLAWMWRRRMRAPSVALVVLLTVVDLVALGRVTNPPQARDLQYAATPGLDWLAARTGIEGDRMISFPATELLPGTLAQLFGIRAVSGTASMVVRETGELVRALDGGMLDPDDARVIGALKQRERLTSPLLELLGVRWVLTQGPLDDVKGYSRAYVGHPEVMAVYAREPAMPPAFLVSRLRVVPDAEQRLAALADGDFQPRREAIVEEAPADHPLEALAGGSCRLTRPRAEEIVVETEAAGPAFLVITESFFPGWRAEINGLPAPLLRTDHAFMGVPLPGGRHEVRVSYRPRSFRLGAIATLIGLVALALLLAVRSPRSAAEAR
ncbi:MAG: YfhO family protein [Planctomycetota bacterium]